MQPGSLLLEILGFVAAILTTLSFLPQALRIRRLGTAGDVSLVMYLMMFFGQGLWLTYAFVIQSPSMVVANGASDEANSFPSIVNTALTAHSPSCRSISISVGSAIVSPGSGFVIEAFASHAEPKKLLKMPPPLLSVEVLAVA